MLITGYQQRNGPAAAIIVTLCAVAAVMLPSTWAALDETHLIPSEHVRAIVSGLSSAVHGLISTAQTVRPFLFAIATFLQKFPVE